MSDKAPASSSPSSPHLLLAFAGVGGEQFAQARSQLVLPNLQALLARLSAEEPDDGDEESLSPPHERALADALGLPQGEGLIPWAAREAVALGLDGKSGSWAFVTPCHWQIGMNEVQQADPAQLGLSADESAQLMEAMRPYFLEDGLTLYPSQTPGRWLASGEPFKDLPTASLDRVIGRDIHIWNLDSGASARPLRRLQQEMQMLMYTHPVNDAREARRAQPVNSFWISGTGNLPARWAANDEAMPSQPDALREAALAQNPNAWQSAWTQIDANEIAALLAASKRGDDVTLTLCGESAWQSWTTQPLGFVEKMKRSMSKPHVQSILESL